VNAPVSGAAVFVNGRLLCMGNERERLLARLGEDTVAVQGGAVVAARVGKAAAADFADSLRAQISDAVVAGVCELLRSRAGRDTARSAVRSRAVEGTVDDRRTATRDRGPGPARAAVPEARPSVSQLTTQRGVS
jgi:hypothetical protein